MDIKKQDTRRFKEIKPKIMYYGTSTFLLTTLNEDGTTNISPMSSSWGSWTLYNPWSRTGRKSHRQFGKAQRMCHKLAWPGIMGKH